MVSLNKKENIEDYLKSQDSAAKTGSKKKIKYRGRAQEFDIFSIPIELLTFNLDNTRFEIEKRKEEKENGPIDPESKTGKKRIIKLLLYSGPTYRKDAKDLMTDIEKNGQTESGVISYDGAVINGNRRLACLIELDEKNPDGRYAYFETIILPTSSIEKDYFNVEADMQWAKDFKEEYNSLNKYQMLKKAKKFGMTTEQIRVLTRFPKKEIEQMFLELKLIEQYLATTKDEDDFSQIENQTELFTDAAKQIKKYVDQNKSARTLTKYKKLIFHLVNLNRKSSNTATYRHIRAYNTAISTGSNRVINAFEKILEIDKPDVAAEALVEAHSKHLNSQYNKQPDKLAEELVEKSNELKNKQREQKFSKGALKQIERAIEILKQILRSS